MPLHTWLTYTVAIGLLPILMRCFVGLTVNSPDFNLLGLGDLISYGLVLSITNINGLLQKVQREPLHTYITGFTIFTLVGFALLSAGSLFVEAGGDKIINLNRQLYICVPLAVTATVTSYLVWVTGKETA